MAAKQSNIIETEGLTVDFGGKTAVNGLNLEVPRGSLFALLGTTGAGKSSLLRVLMNVIRPSAGTATVMSTPSTALNAGHFQRIGYVDGERSLPEWMWPEALLAYCRPFYPAWDDVYCRELLARFKIPLDRRIGRLAEGAKAKLALIASLAYRPALLVLDEPFRGLDTAEKNECIGAVLDIIDQEDWSVLLASSSIDEVERVADWVSLVHEGELKFVESIGALKNRFRLVEAVTVDRAEIAGRVPDAWLDAKTSDHRFRFVDSRYDERETAATVRSIFGETCSVEVSRLPLREIFRCLAKAYDLSL